MTIPAINADRTWFFVFGRINSAGYLIFALLYLRGWLKGGNRIEWSICLLGTLFIPTTSMYLAGKIEHILFY